MDVAAICSEDARLMTPERLARAFERLHDSVVRSDVIRVLGPLRLHATEPRPDVRSALQAYAHLTAAQAEFGDAEQVVLRALQLQVVMDADWWAQVVTALSRSAMPEALAAGLTDIYARLELVAGGLPEMVSLLDSAAETAGTATGGLTLVLHGRDGGEPAITRIVSALDGVGQLWTVAEDLTAQRGPLRLLGIESGPTTSLRFDGLSEPLMELRLLLASISDQVARSSNIPPEQHAALIPEMLPVMDRIGRSGRSDALRARSAVESGVRRLLESGFVLGGDGSVSPPEARPAAASPPPAAPPPAPSHLVAEPATPHGLSDGDLSHLARVIAEERRQLQQAQPARRLWQGAGVR